MTEFTKQYAIRLPNGLLHAHKLGGWVIADGRIQYMESDEPPEPVVYDTLEEAEEAIKRFQSSAAHMGIMEWLGRIETRYCTPFSTTDNADDVIADLEAFLGKGDTDD